jgi:hypothetical protein
MVWYESVGWSNYIRLVAKLNEQTADAFWGLMGTIFPQSNSAV